MSSAPDRYVVIGNPIAHSKSPEIHAHFAAQTEQHLVYERLLAPLDGFVRSVHDLVATGAKGANVTVPFKLEAFSIATVLTKRARMAGAVNTLKFDGTSIQGDNTDGVGLVTDIVHNAGVGMHGKHVLLIGAGGAARGVILPILQQQPSSLTIANRTVSKADELAQLFASFGNVRASAFEALQGPFDLVVNATSASLLSDLPPLSPDVFAPGALAYDMMYGAQPTVFMQFAQQHGAVSRDGLGMLVEQAAEAFLFWRGVRPDTRPVLATLRAQLAQ